MYIQSNIPQYVEKTTRVALVFLAAMFLTVMIPTHFAHAQDYGWDGFDTSGWDSGPVIDEGSNDWATNFDWTTSGGIGTVDCCSLYTGGGSYYNPSYNYSSGASFMPSGYSYASPSYSSSPYTPVMLPSGAPATFNQNTNANISGGDTNTNVNGGNTVTTGPVNVTTGNVTQNQGPINVNVSVPNTGAVQAAPIYYPQPVPQPYSYTAPPAPYYNQPHVSLSQVPYTGLDLGPVGTIIYWLFLAAWCAFGAYLIAVKKVQNQIADKLKAAFLGNEAHIGTKTTHIPASVAHVSAPAPVETEDKVDDFILAQVRRTGAVA